MTQQDNNIFLFVLVLLCCPGCVGTQKSQHPSKKLSNKIVSEDPYRPYVPSKEYREYQKRTGAPETSPRKKRKGKRFKVITRRGVKYIRIRGRWLALRRVRRSRRSKFYFRNHARYRHPWESGLLARYKRSGCEISSLSSEQERFTRRALKHAILALQNKRMHEIIQNKRFTYTSLLGAQITQRVKRTPVRLKFWGYKRRRFSCKVGHRALAFIAYSSLVFINLKHLDGFMRKDAWKKTGGVLAHEWMHAVGFQHGLRGVDIGSYNEQNSVPYYIGCLVENFPNLINAQIRCGRRLRLE